MQLESLHVRDENTLFSRKISKKSAFEFSNLILRSADNLAIRIWESYSTNFKLNSLPYILHIKYSHFGNSLTKPLDRNWEAWFAICMVMAFAYITFSYDLIKKSPSFIPHPTFFNICKILAVLLRSTTKFSTLFPKKIGNSRTQLW